MAFWNIWLIARDHRASVTVFKELPSTEGEYTTEHFSGHRSADEAMVFRGGTEKDPPHRGSSMGLAPLDVVQSKTRPKTWIDPKGREHVLIRLDRPPWNRRLKQAKPMPAPPAPIPEAITSGPGQSRGLTGERDAQPSARPTPDDARDEVLEEYLMRPRFTPAPETEWDREERERQHGLERDRVQRHVVARMNRRGRR